MKLTKEPKAAALFNSHQKGDKGLEIGDAFVICDVRDGTVDFVPLYED